MKRHFLERFVPLREILRPEQNKFASRISRIGFLIALCLTHSALAAPQKLPAAPPDPDPQKCAALTALNLEAAPGGPAIITAARLVEGLPAAYSHLFPSQRICERCWCSGRQHDQAILRRDGLCCVAEQVRVETAVAG